MSDAAEALAVDVEDLVSGFQSLVFGGSAVRVDLVDQDSALEDTGYNRVQFESLKTTMIGNESFTRRVSEPPTMLSPSPSLSLLISRTVSLPGLTSHVAGSAGGSSADDL